MDDKLQQHIAFHLTGLCEGSDLEPMSVRYRPALLARYADVTSLRYDFPLVLNRESAPDRAVLSLSRLIDDVVASFDDDPERDRIARHGYQIEREIRRRLAKKGTDDFASLWHASVTPLAAGDETLQDSASRLWAEFFSAGEVIDVNAVLPTRLISHLWNVVQMGKAREFCEKAERLLYKLHNILEAESQGSFKGRAPERLRAGVGVSFAHTFDFDSLSRILIESKPGIGLSDRRRKRIENLIDVFERQRFYPLGSDAPVAYDFVFDSCDDALKAYAARHREAVELLKALAVADLETSGEYREAVHDAIFDGFGAGVLDADQLAKLPDYLIATNTTALDAHETAEIAELLSAGLPFKILVQTDDILEPSQLVDGHVGLGAISRNLVNTAIGMTDVFVVQSPASNLFRCRDRIMRGLAYNGPALFSVFSGVNAHNANVPSYLVAAAAMESRAFPAFVYDPSAGSDWSERFVIENNPSANSDWPVFGFDFEDESLEARTETLPFTLADFMAMDERFRSRFAVVAKADRHAAMTSLTEALEAETSGVPNDVPALTLVDDQYRLVRAIVDTRTLRDTRRCLNMWHSLQELGGINNSFVEKIVAKGYKPIPGATNSEAAGLSAAAAGATESDAEAKVDTPAPSDINTDGPYIETARCTSCNECTQINNKMFAYNADKQAFIADPYAGTFRELVEAAEGCQVSIIHPGKPLNRNEPGLDDLIKRASEFN